MEFKPKAPRNALMAVSFCNIGTTAPPRGIDVVTLDDDNISTVVLLALRKDDGQLMLVGFPALHKCSKKKEGTQRCSTHL